MPMYEFRCNSCQRKLSFLLRSMSDSAPAECPHCGGKDLVRLFSSFAVHTTGDKDMVDYLMGDRSVMDGLKRDDPKAIADWNERVSRLGPIYEQLLTREERRRKVKGEAEELVEKAEDRIKPRKRRG